MRVGTTFVLLALAGAAGGAWAGRANYFETAVDPVGKTALGSLYDTRHSADNVQYIGCYVNLIAGAARATCEAKDAAGDSLICSSPDPELIKIAQALTDNGYVYFRCDPGGTTLTYLYVSKNSVWLP